jgi:hypothetical protein
MPPPLRFTRGSSSAIPSFPKRGDRLGCESFVQLDYIHLILRQAKAGKQLL